ncbi:MAG: sulfite exporter TauE/SafE family protein, partial [Gammaproteobacteria bacterium]
SMAFGRIRASIRSFMYKAAALVMVLMGSNTFYRGLSFYVDQNFRHHNYFNVLKERIDHLIAYLNRVIDYFGDLIANIQNM